MVVLETTKNTYLLQVLSTIVGLALWIQLVIYKLLGIWLKTLLIWAGPALDIFPAHLRSGKKIKPSDQSYKYPHDHENHYIEQAYMLQQKKYYHPTDQGFEIRIKQQLESKADTSSNDE